MAALIIIALLVVFFNAQKDEPQESVGWQIVGVLCILMLIGWIAGMAEQ